MRPVCLKCVCKSICSFLSFRGSKQMLFTLVIHDVRLLSRRTISCTTIQIKPCKKEKWILSYQIETDGVSRYLSQVLYKPERCLLGLPRSWIALVGGFRAVVDGQKMAIQYAAGLRPDLSCLAVNEPLNSTASGGWGCQTVQGTADTLWLGILEISVEIRACF